LVEFHGFRFQRFPQLGESPGVVSPIHTDTDGAGKEHNPPRDQPRPPRPCAGENEENAV
jgi:hypothetical protein